MIKHTYKFPTQSMATFAASEISKTGRSSILSSGMYVEFGGDCDDAVKRIIEESRGVFVYTTTETKEDLNQALDIHEAKMFPRFKKGKKLTEQGHQVTETLNKALEKIEGYMMDGLSKREAYRMWTKTSGLAVELKQKIGHQIGLDEVAPPAKKKEEKPAKAEPSSKGIEGIAMKTLKTKVEADPKKFPKLAAALGVGKKDAKKEGMNESFEMTEAVSLSSVTPMVTKARGLLQKGGVYKDAMSSLGKYLLKKINAQQLISDMNRLGFTDPKIAKTIKDMDSKFVSKKGAPNASVFTREGFDLSEEPGWHNFTNFFQWSNPWMYIGLLTWFGVAIGPFLMLVMDLMGTAGKISGAASPALKTVSSLRNGHEPTGETLTEAGIKDKLLSVLSTPKIAAKFKDVVASKNTSSFNSKVAALSADVIAAMYKMSSYAMAISVFLDKTKADKVVQDLIKKVAMSDAGVAAVNHLAQAMTSLVMEYNPEGNQITEAYRLQDWARWKKQYASPTPIRIVTKDRKTIDGRIKSIERYSQGSAVGYHITLHPIKQGGTPTVIDDVDIMNVYFGNDAIKMRVIDKSVKTHPSKLKEVAPPSGAGRKIAKKQSSKLAFSKTYGPEKGKQIRYATAWKAYNQGK